MNHQEAAGGTHVSNAAAKDDPMRTIWSCMQIDWAVLIEQEISSFR